MFTVWDCAVVLVDLAACQSSLVAHGTPSVFHLGCWRGSSQLDRASERAENDFCSMRVVSVLMSSRDPSALSGSLCCHLAVSHPWSRLERTVLCKPKLSGLGQGHLVVKLACPISLVVLALFLFMFNHLDLRSSYDVPVLLGES